MILGCIFDEITYTCDEAEKVKEKEDQLNNKIALLGQSLFLKFSSIIETNNLDRQIVNDEINDILISCDEIIKSFNLANINSYEIINDELPYFLQMTIKKDDERKDEEKLNKGKEPVINQMEYKNNTISSTLQINDTNNEILKPFYYDDDDNQFPLNEYKWKDQIEINNVDQINKEAHKLMSGVKKEDDKSSSELRILIIKDMFTLYLDHEANDNPILSEPEFVAHFIEINCNNDTILENVRKYKSLHKIKITDPFIDSELLRKKLSKFNTIHSYAEKKNCIQCYTADINWGGYRKKPIISSDTIKCLISLMIDFPSMSSISYTSYINSKYGSNHINNLAIKTIQKYVNKLYYTIKWSNFEPPSRNSIGLRIYRAAWCSFVNSILNDDDRIIPAFVDEASVIINKAKKNSYSYIGLSPSNSRRGMIGLSVISMMIPRIGLIYKFKDGELNWKDHIQFIEQAISYLRRYMSCNDHEIVVFEDNTLIHNDPINDEIIDQLNITILPIPPHSPKLNFIIGKYLSIIKTILFANKNPNILSGDIHIIKNEWNAATHGIFNQKLLDISFQEWIDLLYKCIDGKSIH